MSESRDDLRVTLWVSPKNRMKGKFNIIAVGESDLDSEMMTRATEDNFLISTLAIRQNKKSELSSTINIKYKDYSYLDATIQTRISEYLEGILNVRPHGRMFGIFEVIEPPRVNEKINPIKDSTTRSSEEYRYINYGNTSTMMVGNNANDILRSFIDFDFSKYPSTLVVESAKLRIRYSGTLSNRDSIELWTVDREWREYGITDANRPLSSFLVSDSYEINEEERYIEFDVLDCVQDIVKQNFSFYGFMMRSKDNTSGLSDSFFTRESSMPPVLDFTYFDTVVPSVGRSEITATLFANSGSIRDLNSTLEVKTDWGRNDLEGTFYVHRADTPFPLDKDAVVAVSMPELRSTIKVVQTDFNELRSRVTIRSVIDKDFEALLAISIPEIQSTIYVNHYSNLASELAVRVKDVNELSSKISVSTPEIHSVFEVKHRSELEAFLTVQQSTEELLSATLDVTRNEMYGTLKARTLRNDDLESYLSVRRYENEELSSLLTVTRNEMHGTLVAKQRGNSDINSTILIYQNDKEEVDSSLAVNQPEVHATMTAVIVSLKDGTMAVNQPEVHSIVAIRVEGKDEMDGFMYPRVLVASDIDSMLFVNNKYRSGAYYFIL